MLAELGVERRLEEIYELVRPLTGQSVGAVLESVPDAARGDLDQLATLGLLALTDTVEVRTIGEAVADLLAEQADAVRAAAAGLDRIRRAVPALREDLEALPAEGAPLHAASVVEDGVEDMLADWISRCPGQIWWIRSGPFGHHDEGKVAVALRSAMARGVRSRAIYPAIAVEEVPDVIFARADAGEEVRFVAELPGRMGMVGGIGAMLPEPWRGPMAGLPRVIGNRRIQLHQPALLAVLDAYFEELWARAVVLPGFEHGRRRTPYGEARTLLLEELVRGAKDEQIARALGTSLRTVRRRIAVLLDDLGVETRFQAGAEAVRRGWI